jgi:ubiquinone/menaquinone biosynthesis C-methylase UbiE
VSNQDAARFFGERAQWYDGGYDRTSSDGHAARARLQATLSLIGPGPGEVLDAGMGAGRMCAALSRAGWTVSGVDAAEQMVTAARARLPDASNRLVVGLIEQLPFADASFDAVTATGVLEYSDVPRALAELERVLRPGGVAVVSYPNPRALYGVWKTRVYYRAVRVVKRVLQMPHPSMPRGAGTIPPDRFRKLLRAAGLEPGATRFSSFLIVPAPLDIALPGISARIGAALEGRAPRWLATQIVYAARKG